MSQTTRILTEFPVCLGDGSEQRKLECIRTQANLNRGDEGNTRIRRASGPRYERDMLTKLGSSLFPCLSLEDFVFCEDFYTVLADDVRSELGVVCDTSHLLHLDRSHDVALVNSCAQEHDALR